MSDNLITGNGDGFEVKVTEAIDPLDAVNPTEAIDSEGTRLENFISPRTFVAMADILPLLTGVPAGHAVPLGHIAGYVRGYERRDSGLPVKAGDKIPPPSIWLRGVFEATSYQTGEITRATWAILPRVMGELVAEALDSGEGEAVLDLELGVAATGRAIPYTYTVTTYAANRQQTALTAIRMRHQKRQVAKAEKIKAQLIAAGKAVVAIEDHTALKVAAQQADIREAKNELKNLRKR